jgi:hypothetical protein
VGIEEVFSQFSDAFSVGLGLEAEALALEEGLELLIVGNDTVVNDSELPFRIGSG